MAITQEAQALTVADVRRFSVEEFDRMVAAGVFDDEDERIELLEGVVVTMTPIGDPHAACVNRLNERLSQRLSGQAIVAVQNPIALPRSRPVPDLAILRRRGDYYARGKPRPPEIFLVIEVADTSLPRDRDVKLPAYGRAGVPETWVVDLAGEQVIVGARPGRAGYSSITVRRRGERLAVPGFAEVTLMVDEILGAATE